ncbi:polyprenyl diphosphate synthase [Candidatus Absconditicoccus praedator]|uniref:polyprenyl diphosphate synthase n=1 Tax=Candidatus Absconditicoccus praedator TaxID=2735562 RepID=UPI001E4752CB|nr:polyprenyl diphosphate synthase [Candidatus Absconditicoccus praedator]
MMNYPKHVGLIPDGNRTWAKTQNIPKFWGHLEGFNRCIELCNHIFTNTDIKVFSIWGLSTENRKGRTNEELDYLFGLYKKVPINLEKFLKEKKVNFRFVGNLDGIPKDLADFLKDKQKELTFDTDKYLVLAINYGGRDEVVRGIKNMASNMIQQGKYNLNDIQDDITEENLSKHLDFGDLPNIELVIRTKGNLAKRLSGFMLWWVGYAELYFSEKKCPEFNSKDLDEALSWFNNVYKERNFGK